jgi:MFS transporter, DHA1 family, inner membrane transport protein
MASSPRWPVPILALSLAAFAIGTTEFVIMGILPEVARDLRVSVPAAGLLVTGYALGVAVGSPLVATLTARWPRKPTLVGLMAVFVLGNVLSAAAPSYGLLMVGRAVAALAHGSFFGIGSVVASGLVESRRRAGAIALMFTGLTLANVLGVPLGTLVGQAWGWRATFWAIAGFGGLAVLAVARLVPATDPQGPGEESDHPWRVLRRPGLLLALLLTVLGFGGIFTAFTFITPLLEQCTGLSPRRVTAVLFLFGLGLTLGNALGGRLADWRPLRSMIGILLALAASEILLAATVDSPWAATVTVFLWGMAAFATVPGLQAHVVDEAREAPTLASTLNIAAFNLGNAAGAWLGGSALLHGVELRALPLLAAGEAALATVVAAASLALVEARTVRGRSPLACPPQPVQSSRPVTIREGPDHKP